jgi:hypothetical protein
MNPAVSMRSDQGNLVLKIRLLKAALETSATGEQRAALISLLHIFKKAVRAELRRCARRGTDKTYQNVLLMIEHECDLDTPRGG